jgi:hypothetical protein
MQQDVPTLNTAIHADRHERDVVSFPHGALLVEVAIKIAAAPRAPGWPLWTHRFTRS